MQAAEYCRSCCHFLCWSSPIPYYNKPDPSFSHHSTRSLIYSTPWRCDLFSLSSSGVERRRDRALLLVRALYIVAARANCDRHHGSSRPEVDTCNHLGFWQLGLGKVGRHAVTHSGVYFHRHSGEPSRSPYQLARPAARPPTPVQCTTSHCSLFPPSLHLLTRPPHADTRPLGPTCTALLVQGRQLKTTILPSEART